METGELPGGMPAVAVRGIERARLGTAVPGTGQALWVEVEHIAEGPSHRRGHRAGPRVPGRGGEHPPGQGRRPVGRAPGRRDRARPGGRHGRLLARPVPGPEGRGPGDRRRRGTAAAGHRLGPRGAGRPDPARADQDRRRRGHGEDPARVPAAPAAGVDPQGAGPARLRRRGRRPTTTGARLEDSGPARGRAQGGRPRDRQAGADERAEPRARVDPHLVGHRARAALGRAVRGPARRGRGVAHPRRGP